MAGFNEILVGRYNRLAQKLLSMKGARTLTILNPSLQFDVPLFYGVENRYLEDWRRYGRVEQVAGVAAQQAAAKLRNPAGSNVIGVIEAIQVSGQTNLQVVLQLTVSNTDYAAPSSGQRLDARLGGQASTLSSSANGTGANLTSSIGLASFLANTTWDFINDADTQLTVLPGDAVQVIANVVNVGFQIGWRWRERLLEDSERA